MIIKLENPLRGFTVVELRVTERDMVNLAMREYRPEESAGFKE